MQKHNAMPWRVFLALANIEIRKTGLMLVWSSLIISVYCIPWTIYFAHRWIGRLSLLDNWEWFTMMLPMTTWYWPSVKWVDKNRDWQETPATNPA